MASPKRPESGYGYSMPSQASPDYPQYPQPTAPYNPQPFDINSLFRLLGGTAPQPSSGGTGGVGGPAPAVMPVGPAQPLPLASMPMGSVTPPQAPLRAVEDPYSTSTSRDFGFIGGMPPQVPQMPQAGGLDIQSLLAALRAMQNRRQPSATPQAPEGREGTPRMVPSPTMRGSGMGLEGILRGIEASRSSR